MELKSPAGTRYTQSEVSGKFLFDGLEAGDYLLSIYAPGFPDVVKLLSGRSASTWTRKDVPARFCRFRKPLGTWV